MYVTDWYEVEFARTQRGEIGMDNEKMIAENEVASAEVSVEEEKKTGSVEHPVASTPDVLKVPKETSIGFAIFSMVRGIASILRPAFFPDLFHVCLFLPLGDGKHRTLRLLSSDGRGERRKVLLGRDHHGLVRNRLVRGCGPLLSDFLAPESWIHPLLRKRR